MADLSTEQLTALKTDITVTNAAQPWRARTLVEWYNDQEWQITAEWYQELKTPENLIWRPDISPEEMACVVDAEELCSLPAPNDLKLMTWNIITRVPAVNATDSQTQQNFNWLFGPQGSPAAPTTFANLMGVAQRPATNGEDLYTGPPWSSGTSISGIYGQDITAENVRDTTRV